MTGRNIHYSDDLENSIGDLLEHCKIEFTHESECKEQKLDFYLPKYDVYIEVKQFHADRISRQMQSKNNVIAIQGRKSINLLKTILNGRL